jgi:hypothetical protein
MEKSFFTIDTWMSLLTPKKYATTLTALMSVCANRPPELQRTCEINEKSIIPLAIGANASKPLLFIAETLDK